LLNYFESFLSTFPKTGTKFYANTLFLSLTHRENRHGSHTRLQINACKNCPRHPTYVKLGSLIRAVRRDLVALHKIVPHILYSHLSSLDNLMIAYIQGRNM
jgi:hypothetical protein